MKLEKLNSWLTLLANLGVLAGIVFLVIELDQSNRQAQSSTFQARINEIDQQGREFAVSEFLPELYVKIRETGVSSLTPVERERVVSWEGSRMARINGQYVQYQEGFLDDDSYEQMMEIGSRVLPLWKELNIADSSVFAQLIEALEFETASHSNE